MDRYVGLDVHATSCTAEAIATFPPPGPSSQWFERQRQLESLSQEQIDRLYLLNKRFYAYPEPTEILLANYARQHLAEFLET
jgi:hypothetical protein